MAKANPVVAFSGQIASGKSTISRALAEMLSWKRVSFGDYVRKIATARGLDSTSMPILQELGEQLVRSDPKAFCRAVLDERGRRPGEPLIMDGLRHAEVVHELRSLVKPSPFFIVYISTRKETREQRLSQRAQIDPTVVPRLLREFDAHAMEAEVSQVLVKMADFWANGENDPSLVASQIVSWLMLQ